MSSSGFYHPKRLPANEDRIYKQRQYEEARQERIAHVNHYEHMMRCAEFEQANEPKLKYRAVSEHDQAEKAVHDRELAVRRRRLNELLQEEEESLHCELHTATMGLNERRAWLEARARQLKQERLARDKSYADEQMDRVFRESCDDMRALNSKMAVLRAEALRKKQREANLAKKRVEAEHKNIYKDVSAIDRKKMHEEDLQELILKKVRKMEAMEILQEQIGLVERLREEERETYGEEMRQLVRKWQDEDNQLKAQQAVRRQKDMEEAQDQIRYNERVKGNRSREAREEKQMDAKMVEMTNERERAEENQEKQLKEQQRHEAIAYAAYLKEMMAKQMESEAELEAMIQHEVDEEWKKKDQEMAYQEEKRNRLMARIHEERQAQLKFKEQLQKTKDEEKRVELERLQADMRAMEIEKQRQSLESHMSKQDLYQAIQSQVRNKQASELLAQSHMRHEFEGAMAAEQMYNDKVQDALNLPFPEPKHGRKNAQWMY